MMTEGTSEHWAGISGRLKNWLDIRAQLQGVRLLTKAPDTKRLIWLRSTPVQLPTVALFVRTRQAATVWALA